MKNILSKAKEIIGNMQLSDCAFRIKVCIEGCKTVDQVYSCMNMIENFERLGGEEKEILRLITLSERKKNEIDRINKRLEFLNGVA